MFISQNDLKYLSSKEIAWWTFAMMLAVVLCFTVPLFVAGCEEHEEVGTLSHACFPNFTCNDNLTCIRWSTWTKNNGKWITRYNYTPHDAGGLDESYASVCADTKTMVISDIRKGQ